MTLHFHIPGPPVAWSRARLNGRVHFKVRRLAAYQQEAKAKAKDAGAVVIPKAEPVSVAIRVVLPIPASWRKDLRQAAKEGRVRPTSRPDADNFGKTLLDALSGVAYHDDSQVTELSVSKIYGETPGMWVVVDRIPTVGRVAA